LAPQPDYFGEAQAAFARGEYARAAALAGVLVTEPAAVLQVRSLANLDLRQASAACAAAVARHRLSPELHYLQAILLMETGKEQEAIATLRRVLYLDRSLAMAHFTLGALLRRNGDRAGARRAYRNVQELCRSGPADAAVPLSDGEPAARLAEAAACHLTILDDRAEAPS
jgi:chemotaxis protein methyltransferase CheR